MRAGRQGKERVRTREGESAVDGGGSLSEEWTAQVKGCRQVRQEQGEEEEEEVNAQGTDPKLGPVKPKRKIRTGIPEAAFPPP